MRRGRARPSGYLPEFLDALDAGAGGVLGTRRWRGGAALSGTFEPGGGVDRIFSLRRVESAAAAPLGVVAMAAVAFFFSSEGPFCGGIGILCWSTLGVPQRETSIFTLSICVDLPAASTL